MGEGNHWDRATLQGILAKGHMCYLSHVTTVEAVALLSLEKDLSLKK